MLLARAFNSLNMTRMASEATVKGHWFWGMGREFAERPLESLNACAALGDVVRMRFGFIPIVQLNHPEHIKHVFQNPRIYGKQTLTYERLRDLLGLGLVVSDGEFWKRQRRIAQPAFHRERISGFADTMVRAAGALGDRWQAAAERGESVELAAEFARATLAVVCETLLGGDVAEDNEQVARAFPVLNEIMSERLDHFVPTPLWIPTRENRRFRAALAELDTTIYRIVARRRAAPDGDGARGDLLSMLMHARDEETGATMNDRQLRDEVATMLIAGYETTAVALTWTFYLLSQHPEVEARLHQELAALDGRAPTLADAERLPYTRQVIDEALRLYPPVWAVVRGAAVDDVIDGHAIKKGSYVMVSPWVVQRSPGWWPEPEAFRPERFARDAQELPRYAYFPFIGGPRQCIGNTFALLEATIMLATLAQRFRLRLVPGQTVELLPLLTLRPKHGIYMTPMPLAPPLRTAA
jgi:cytochrome P450